MLKPSPVLALLLALLPAAGERPAQPEPVHGLPGSLPGTERWLVTFKDRSFDLEAFRAAVYGRAPAAEVVAIVAGLEEKVRADQADFARFIAGLEGRVEAQWWLINGCAVDVPPARLDEVRSHPRVMLLQPDRLHSPVAPILTSTNTSNHNVDPLQAQSLLAQGVTVAIMDTGQDSDMGGTGRPHQTYFVNGDVNNKTGGGLGGSRLLANIQVGSMAADDVHGHGTGCCGIAAGEKWGTAGADRGHAPLASIVGYAIANNTNGDSSSATMTSAWQKIAADKAIYGTVAANNSYSGSPSPLDATQQAQDSAALNADILPCVAAGNNGASSASSQSAVNGLATGAVAPNTKAVASFSSRGPLSGDTARFYPDLCACGVNTVMPARNNEAGNYTGSGTSMASPQTCGAATLFRSILTTATALETKAALLATTEDVSLKNTTAPYNTRNAYGLGFLRDDRAAAIAQGQGLLKTLVLAKASPINTVDLNVTKGKAYAAVAAWHRHNLGSTNWSDLALQARVGSLVLAVSNDPRNLYEKVVFLAPATGKVTLEVSGSFLEIDNLPVAVAALEVPAPFIPGSAAAYAAGCPGTGQAETVTAVVPQAYQNAFGETRTSVCLGYYPHRVQQVFSPTAVPASFAAAGLLFRHDNAELRSINNYWIDLTVDIGTTTATPATLGTAFAGNLTGPMTRLVNAVRVNLPYWTALNADPRQWLIRIPFGQPYNYTAQTGQNLIVDMIRSNASTGTGNAYYHIDATNNANGLVSRVFSTSAAAATGTVTRNLGAVMAFWQLSTGNVVPVLAGEPAPEIGKSFQAKLSRARASAGAAILLGVSDAQWGALSLPLDLGPLGAPGCRLLASLQLLLPVVTDAAGAAALSLAVPNDKALIQTPLYLQGLVLDPAANQAGLALTPGLRVLIGGQP